MNLLAQTTTYDNSGAGAAAAMAAASGAILIAVLVAVVISIIIYFVILKRAGFNPWLSLLVLIPGVGQLIIMIILVFTEWPVQREVKALRAQLGGGGPGGPIPGAGYTTQAPPTYGAPLPPPGTPPATT
ncbi:MAG TPA: hypothetical protein VHT53_11480 [Candidatus Elarobacter sp.]|jgi:hypothetical protein|nr:hypothetical protein [Candidatus Elarobacter sp.]